MIPVRAHSTQANNARTESTAVNSGISRRDAVLFPLITQHVEHSHSLHYIISSNLLFLGHCENSSFQRRLL